MEKWHIFTAKLWILVHETEGIDLLKLHISTLMYTVLSIVVRTGSTTSLLAPSEGVRAE